MKRFFFVLTVVISYNFIVVVVVVVGVYCYISTRDCSYIHVFRVLSKVRIYTAIVGIGIYQ